MARVRDKSGKSKKAPAAGAGPRRGSSTAAASPILKLQRTAGNAAVARLMRSGLSEHEVEVSQPGDTRELEAERMAEQAITPQPEETASADSPPQRAADGAPSLLDGLGPGRPLDSESRSLLEPRFGRDLGGVRVHTGAQAEELARATGARAFALGRDVVFGRGEHRPQTTEGQRLLAHEVAHTVQQGQPGALPAVQRVPVGEWLTRLFGEGTFTDDELQEYLTFLDTEKKIRGGFQDDNMAREIVRRWQKGDSLYILPVRRKILLTEEMLDGPTLDDDEQAILTLLRGSTDAEFGEILTQVGKERLLDNFHGSERKELEALLAAREPKAHGAKEEGFPGETILELQQRFTSNAELEHDVRLNCILIVRELAPRMFAENPALADKVEQGLGKMKGKDVKMTEAGRILTEVGAATGPVVIKFDNGNGNAEPTAMVESAWDKILGMVGTTPGWHIFGLALFNGYHSVTVLVDNRPDGPRVYWADQWAIDPGDDFAQAAGSASGFRHYEKAGFDKFITDKTREWWSGVFTEKGKKWEASLKIWKFQLRP
jgi:uncharacterized protein DUF4157